MPELRYTIAIAIAASIGFAGAAAPASAKETNDQHAARSKRPTDSVVVPRPSHRLEVDAMKQASAGITGTSMVPGSDSAGDHDARQTFAVATGLYGR